MNPPELRTTPFLVHIPNLDDDGIAETVSVDVQCFTDPETGLEVLTPESLELIDRTKARRMGLILPNELKSLRERLDLSQDEISNLLQIGAKTYTRWETGRARPSRSMNVMLCALRDGVITVEYLRALRIGSGVTHLFAELIFKSKWRPSGNCGRWFATSIGSGHKTPRMPVRPPHSDLGKQAMAGLEGQRLARSAFNEAILFGCDSSNFRITDCQLSSRPRHQWVEE